MTPEVEGVPKLRGMLRAPAVPDERKVVTMFGVRDVLPALARRFRTTALTTILPLGVATVAPAATPDAPFSFGVDFGPGDDVASLATADLDGDGVPELIACEPLADRIAIRVPDGGEANREPSCVANASAYATLEPW